MNSGGNLEREGRSRALHRGRFVLELGTVPGRYGQVFPKGEHLSVPASAGRRAKAAPARPSGPPVRRARDPPDDLEEVRGHRLHSVHRTRRSRAARALVAGDAGGLIDPLTGDGMYEAFFAGRLASKAVLELLAGEAESLDAYGPRLTRHLAVHLWAAWSLRAALDRFPRTTYALAKGRLVWPVVENS